MQAFHPTVVQMAILSEFQVEHICQQLIGLLKCKERGCSQLLVSPFL